MVFHEEDASHVAIDPAECVDSEGGVAGDVACPTLQAYTAATMEAVQAERAAVREAMDKWTDLDDEYDFGVPGEPLTDEVGELVADELSSGGGVGYMSSVLYYSVIGALAVLLASFCTLGVYCCCRCGRKRKDEMLSSDFLYT